MKTLKVDEKKTIKRNFIYMEKKTDFTYRIMT